MVRAAGAVVTRKNDDVLLVHRPSYDDWAFPKGKLDRAERPMVAAVREVYEETGLQIRLGPPLPNQQYPIRIGSKIVYYWAGFVPGDDDLSGFKPNQEIDQVRWVPRDELQDTLTYGMDRATLASAHRVRRESWPLIILRHAQARSRRAWGRKKDDRLRPLIKPGRIQAAKLAPVLGAYDVENIITSSSTRCVETIQPYADASGWPIAAYDELTEEAATHDSVLDLVDDVFHTDESAVICAHRPVLPAIFDVLRMEPVELEPGKMVVLHRRRGRILAVEYH